MGHRLDRWEAFAVLRRFGLGTVAYAVAIALAFVSAYLALGLHAALALYYSFDQQRPRGRSN